MGIHGLGQVNNQELQKLLAAKGIQGGHRPATATQQNVDMTRNGSIFNIATPNGVNRRGFNEQNADNAVRQEPKTENSTQTQNFSIAGGQQAISGVKGKMTATKSGTSQTQQHQKQVKTLTSQSKKLSKSTSKEEAEIAKKLKTNQRLVDKNNAQLQKLTQNMISEEFAIQELNAELESLMDAGTSISPDDNGGLLSSNNDQIAAIQSKIGARSAGMSKYSGKINKLQLSNNTAIRTMNRTSRLYQRTIARNQKTMESAQSTTEKVMNVANKVGEISQYTTMAGQGVQLIGKGMRLAGEAMLSNPITAAAGAALVSASIPVESTGVVTETVGNYGSMAASVTKSACCMAEGDFQGAFQNLAAAAATGAAAVQGTQQMASGFASIKDQATQAMQSGLEKQAAKQLAKGNMENLQAEGFTKKQIKQMATEQTAGSFEGKSMAEMQADINASKFDANGNKIKIQDRNTSSYVQNTIENNQTAFANNKIEITKTGNGNKAAKTMMDNKAKFAKTSEILQKTGQSLQTLGAYFPEGNLASVYGNNSSYTGNATQNWDVLRYIQARNRLI